MASFTFDIAGLLLVVACVLLAVGTIPFTPVSVAVLLVLSKSELSTTWSRA